MGNQKQAVMDLVERHRNEGRRISEVLGSVGIARALLPVEEGPRGENGAAAKLVSDNLE